MATREANNSEWSRRKRSPKTYAEWEDVREARRDRIYGANRRPSQKWKRGPLGTSERNPITKPEWF